MSHGSPVTDQPEGPLTSLSAIPATEGSAPSPAAQTGRAAGATTG